MTEKSGTARQLALSALMQMEGQGYSNIVLGRLLDGAALSEEDKAFATRLFYGVLERRLTLDHIIGRLSAKPPEPVVRNILRLGLFQILHMQAVPDHTAVDESVKLCRIFQKSSAGGFVNAVLRRFVREGKSLGLERIANPIQRLSVAYSCDQDVAGALVERWGEAEATALLEWSLEAPPIYARVNTVKIDPPELMQRLKQEGAAARPVEALEGCLQMDGLGGLEKLPSFQEGLFHIQDLSSQLCAWTVAEGLKPGAVILDLCAAPGGKTFTLSQLAPESQIYAYDVYDFKVKLIQAGAARLGLRNIEAAVSSAEEHDDRVPKADRILCDLPCSGFGIMAKKPEIKYKKKNEYENLPSLQLKMLENAADYLKVGGVLVYSTCTLLDAENRGVIDTFIKRNKNFTPHPLPTFLKPCLEVGVDYAATILPRHFGSDGFFISAVTKECEQE